MSWQLRRRLHRPRRWPSGDGGANSRLSGSRPSPPVLAGGTPHARALARAAPRSGRGHPAPEHRGHRGERRWPRDVTLTLSDATVLAADHVHLRFRLPGRSGPGSLPRRRCRPGVDHRRVPGPERGLRDIVDRAVHDRLRVDPRLRPLLRLHRRLRIRGPHHRHRDDDVGVKCTAGQSGGGTRAPLQVLTPSTTRDSSKGVSAAWARRPSAVLRRSLRVGQTCVARAALTRAKASPRRPRLLPYRGSL